MTRGSKSPSPSRVRTVQSLCEAAGAVLVATACFMIWIPLGVLVVGATLVLIGNLKAGK